MNKTRVNFWVNAGLFVALVLMVMHEATGIDSHQILGMVLAGGLVVHQVLHWKWITTVIRRWSQLSFIVRRNAMIDALLMLAFAWTLVSGIVISPLLWGDQASSRLIHPHHAGAALTFLMVSAHLILHRKWIGNSIKRSILGVYTLESTSARKPSSRS